MSTKHNNISFFRDNKNKTQAKVSPVVSPSPSPSIPNQQPYNPHYPYQPVQGQKYTEVIPNWDNVRIKSLNELLSNEKYVDIARNNTTKTECETEKINLVWEVSANRLLASTDGVVDLCKYVDFSDFGYPAGKLRAVIIKDVKVNSIKNDTGIPFGVYVDGVRTNTYFEGDSENSEMKTPPYSHVIASKEWNEGSGGGLKLYPYVDVGYAGAIADRYFFSDDELTATTLASYTPYTPYTQIKKLESSTRDNTIGKSSQGYISNFFKQHAVNLPPFDGRYILEDAETKTTYYEKTLYDKLAFEAKEFKKQLPAQDNLHIQLVPANIEPSKRHDFLQQNLTDGDAKIIISYTFTIVPYKIKQFV